MTTREFGRIGDHAVHEATIAAPGGLSASVLEYGAVLRDLVVPVAGKPRSVTLGFDSLDHYIAHSPHAGAIAGRVANRIAGGRFTLDGTGHQVPQNQAGKHALHGGGRPYAFGLRPWTLMNAGPATLTLGLHSPDGDGGFPGALDVIATYRIEGMTLTLDLSAMTLAPTVINLAQHSYFNLDGARGPGDASDVRDHTLVLSSDFYTPVDADLIPTGEVRAVAGTPYDFRAARPIRLAGHAGYDTNFALRGPRGALRHAATLTAADKALAMEMWTTEPAVQLYDAGKLNSPVPGLGGARYGANAGVCLEAQTFPDAPNNGHFPSAVLRPGEVYRQTTQWRFKGSGP